MERADGRETSLLTIGTGVLGGNVLDLLAWRGFPGPITVGGRNDRALRERSNLTRLSAYNQGQYPTIRTRFIDLADIDRTAETIAEVQPDIIFNATSVQTYWRISKLPPAVHAELAYAGIGPWLPMHLAPAHALMTAVHRSGQHPTVVNAAYPDGTNPALATQGLAPALGVGNLMNVVPVLRTGAARMLGAPVSEVTLRLIAHHFTSNRLPEHGDAGEAPYHLRFYHRGRDVSEAIDDATVFGLLPTELRRTRGSAGMYVTASSAYAVLSALTGPESTAVHAPAPFGLVGGYPVTVSRSGIALDLPDSCGPDEAIVINEQAQRFDGIDSIAADGTITLTEQAVEIVERMIGHRCSSFAVPDCREWAMELLRAYLTFENDQLEKVAV